MYRYVKQRAQSSYHFTKYALEEYFYYNLALYREHQQKVYPYLLIRLCKCELLKTHIGLFTCEYVYSFDIPSHIQFVKRDKRDKCCM